MKNKSSGYGWMSLPVSPVSRLGGILSGLICIALVLGCNKNSEDVSYPRLVFHSEAVSPDGRFVAFIGAVDHDQLTDSLTVILAKSREDKSTWVQLAPWGQYHSYSPPTWIGDKTLRIKAGQISRLKPSYLRLMKCYGVEIKWDVAEIEGTPK
jgi:hypothetical protein